MPAYYEECKNEVLVIDLPEGHMWKARMLLKDFSIPGVCYIEAPVPSAGHSKADPRSFIRMRFEGNASTTFDNELIRRRVHFQLAPFHALIGWSPMVNDEYTILLVDGHPWLTMSTRFSLMCPKPVVAISMQDSARV